MKVICLQEKFKKSLEIVDKIVGKNISLPILQNILLETEKNKFKISSTDLEIGISTWVTGKIEKIGRITIPAKILSNFVSLIPNKKITLDVKKGNLQLTSESYKAVFFGEKAENFPLIPEIKKGKVFSVSSLDFTQNLMYVVKSVSLSDSRPEISGVYFNFGDKILTLAATDSFRLAEKKIFLNERVENCSFIVPQRAVHEIIRIFRGYSEKIKIIVQNNQALFKTKDVELVTRLVEGEYPQYQEIIPKTFETEILIEREGFLNEVKVNSFFSGKNSDITIEVDQEKSSLSVFAKGAGVGESSSKINFKNKRTSHKKKIELIFNYKYIVDGLIDIKSSIVLFKLNSEISPVVLQPEKESNHIYLVMPIKNT